MSLTRIVLTGLIAAGMLPAQSPAGPNNTPHFEVASVKTLPPGGRGGRPSGGPGRGDMSQFSWPGASLRNLLAQAWMVSSDQVTGPDWIGTEMYSIAAKIPEGTTSEDFSTMFRNLLTERFRMTLHRETKVIDGYDLIVAKGGPKLKESLQTTSDGRGQFGPDGATLTYNNTTMQVFAVNLMMRIRAGDLAENPGDRPAIVRIVDKTGLTGTYDIKLHYAMPRSDTPGDDMLHALESQLGLSLKPTKVSVEMVVVDHAEKTPTEN